MKSASKAMAVNGRRAGTPAVSADGLAVAGSRVVLPWCIGRAEAAASIGPGYPGRGSRLSIRPADAELALLTMRAAKGGTMLNPPRRTARGEELTGDERCSGPGDGRVRHQRPALRIVASAGTCGRVRHRVKEARAW